MNRSMQKSYATQMAHSVLDIQVGGSALQLDKDSSKLLPKVKNANAHSYMSESMLGPVRQQRRYQRR